MSLLFVWPMILLGVLWAANPQMLKSALTRRTHWKTFWLAAAVLLLPLLRLGASRGLLGVAVVLIVFGLIVGRAHAAVGAAFEKVPLVHFRTAAVLNIVGGVCMLRLN
jgi:hypothetical protein